jgi:hypothetical protein
MQKAELFTNGFLVIVGLVSLPICTAAAASIRSRVTRTMQRMKVSTGGHFREMLGANWINSPDGWTGLPFGSVCSRGWQVGPGTGRSGEAFHPRDLSSSMRDTETNQLISDIQYQ